MRAEIAKDDGVAIGRGAHDTAARQRAGCADDVLDHDGLAQRLAHALGENARQHVGGPGRREWHHHGDRARWVGLRWYVGRNRGERGNADGKPEESAGVESAWCALQMCMCGARGGRIGIS